MAVINEFPSTPSLLVASVILAALVYSAVLVYKLFFSPLSKIPGPWITKISAIPGANAVKDQRRTDWENSLFAQHPGTVAVRIGPNAVSFNHPDAVKAIYGMPNLPRQMYLADNG